MSKAYENEENLWKIPLLAKEGIGVVGKKGDKTAKIKKEAFL